MNPDWFKDRLRELRLKAGLNRKELAERAGMKVGGIRDLEQGVNKPSWVSVLALCRALNCTCDEFCRAPSADLPAPRAGRPKGRPAKREPSADKTEEKPQPKRKRTKGDQK